MTYFVNLFAAIISLTLVAPSLAFGIEGGWRSDGWMAKAGDSFCLLQTSYLQEDHDSNNVLYSLSLAFYRANLQTEYPHIVEDFGFDLGETVLIVTMYYRGNMPGKHEGNILTTDPTLDGIALTAASPHHPNYWVLAPDKQGEIYSLLRQGKPVVYIGRDSEGDTHTREISPHNFSVASAMYVACNETMSKQSAVGEPRYDDS